MGFVKEFRDFAVKGNVVELAIAVIIGAAFGDRPAHDLTPETAELVPVDPVLCPASCRVTGEGDGTP